MNDRGFLFYPGPAGRLIHNVEMRIGWGKAVAIPQQPIWPPRNSAEAQSLTLPVIGNVMAFLQPGVKPGTRISDLVQAPSQQQANLRAITQSGGGGANASAGGAGGPGSGGAICGPRPSEVEVRFPTDTRLLHIIDTMAAFVAQDGCPFEQEVMRREMENPVRISANLGVSWRIQKNIIGCV